MSSTIELLQIGFTAQQLIDTVNALVAAHNDGADAAITSYNDLTDKPRINGVTLSGSKTTEDLKIKVSEAIDFNTFEAAFASKGYVDAADASTLAAASAAVDAALDDKMDAGLAGVSTATVVDDDAYIPVVSNGLLYKVRLRDVAAYSEVKATASKAVLSDAVKSQRQVLNLSGTKDGTNVLFTLEDGYVIGTSFLYLNGQLLTSGTDYQESSSYSITMLTYIPESSDVMVFLAVPLPS